MIYFATLINYKNALFEIHMNAGIPLSEAFFHFGELSSRTTLSVSGVLAVSLIDAAVGVTVPRAPGRRRAIRMSTKAPTNDFDFGTAGYTPFLYTVT
jgi:hypothetical protein